MIINHNLQAMNTHRQLGISGNAGAKSMEKLSSGYRINRAGDDAAGLAISEKMRGQIRGLNQASRNAQDGISLIQTAEGALDETHAILQRMRELAVQSSTDTNTDKDRENIQDEIDELATEITRIAETTQFNTMNLLDGTFTGKKFHIGANAKQNVGLDIDSMDAEALGIDKDDFFKNTAMGNGLTNIEFTSADGETVKITFKVGTAAGNATVTDTTVAQDKDGGYVITLAQAGAATATAPAGAVTATEAQIFAAMEKAGLNVVQKEGSTLGATAVTITNDTDGSVEFDPEDDEDIIAELKKGKGINVSTQEKADGAITTINSALEKVSKQRSKLGAVQNRLEHTIKNLDTSAENLQASEARIRDVDMAKEMMEQTKQNILQQASTAMLAQANQAPQNVLQLLR